MLKFRGCKSYVENDSVHWSAQRMSELPLRFGGLLEGSEHVCTCAYWMHLISLEQALLSLQDLTKTHVPRNQAATTGHKASVVNTWVNDGQWSLMPWASLV